VRKVARVAALLLVALAAGMAPGSARPAELPLLGAAEAAAGPDDVPPQWGRVLRDIAREAPVLDLCRRTLGRCPDGGTRSWLELLDGLAGRPAIEQVQAVQRFVNRWAYRTDLANHGRSDLWVTPTEFFARSGDCEDYAIAKYVSLRRLGFPDRQLRLVVLDDTARGIAHAVLAVYLDGGVWILDNLADDALPQARLPHYRPYYSLNEEGGWTHGPSRTPAGAAAANPPGS
jgi:predicted transglutaminase-like cysteine proteinase